MMCVVYAIYVIYVRYVVYACIHACYFMFRSVLFYYGMAGMVGIYVMSCHEMSCCNVCMTLVYVVRVVIAMKL